MHELMRQQSGVISRAQLIALGLRPHDIARARRRRELTTIHPGVFVGHTGEPTWEQRAWAGVLYCQQVVDGAPHPESAALHGGTALAAAERSASGAPRRVEVAIADERRVRAPKELSVVRSSLLLSQVRWHLAPPRVRYEDAVVAVAADHSTTLDVVAELSRAVGTRRTTAERLLEGVERRQRLAHRTLIAGVLADVAAGTCSVLEHGYLTRVERAHGLPPAQRQTRGRSRTSVVYRDATYDGLVVELDGRLWHDTVEQRDLDADRDLVAAVAGSATIRLTWGQVFDRSCWTTAHVARLMHVRPRPCGPGCTVLDV